MLDIVDILKILPHRYPFLLVDRVVELVGRKRAVGIKNVSCNEPFFVGHWPGRPIMPGVLILEALAQTAGLLIAQWADPKTHMAVIAAMDGVKIRRRIVPGDQLRLVIEERKARPRMAEFSAEARVGDDVAAEATIRFVVLPNDEAAA